MRRRLRPRGARPAAPARRVVGCAGALVTLLALPPAASADVACSFSGATVAVETDSPPPTTDIVGLIRSGNEIAVYDGEPPPGSGTRLICGGTPTVANTDRIRVDEVSGGADTRVTISLAGGFLEPGLSAEPEPVPEIEIDLSLGTGSDAVTLLGREGDDLIRMGGGMSGPQGIDLNAGLEPTEPDSDVLISGDEAVHIFTDGRNPAVGGNDAVLAQGGSPPEYSNPWNGRELALHGGPGNDYLNSGGTVAVSFLDGAAGDDFISTGAYVNGSVLRLGAGNDIATGGSGPNDIGLYDDSPAGVTVDLATTDPQDTGGGGVDQLSGIENLYGSRHDDVLIGTDRGETLTGDPAGSFSGGNDVLVGRGGDDVLHGMAGTDAAGYQLGSTGPVTVDLNLTRGQQTGGAGFDRLADIEDLFGSPFSDVLTGDGQPNRIVGLGGRDSITSFGGADTIDIRDGGPDDVSCGSPTPGPPGDFVAADWRQVDIVSPDCEQVEFELELPGDVSPPETAIDAHPRKRIRGHDARFSFSSTEEGVMFECRLDGGPWSTCGSPRRVRVSRGRHRFFVRSKDGAGNLDPTPAKFRFTRVS